MSKISIVLGLGFGDEGKGRTVSYLVSQSEKPLVVRFSGGHQAGHTVVIGDKRHVFSNFGSGTLQGAPTYWSEFCTVHPSGLVKEYKALLKMGLNPVIYIDPLSPVTTPYDIFANRQNDSNYLHGTCGTGFGQTLERHQLLKLHFRDIFYKSVFDAKLDNVKKYYECKHLFFNDIEFESRMALYLDAVEFIRNCKLGKNTLSFDDYDHLIFEGSQGILLDQDYGFFPNVTRSYTTSRNVLKLIETQFPTNSLNIFYVTRSYQTRHGNGFMSDIQELELVNNENETNKYNPYQGHFRTGYLDIDLLKYALEADENEHKKYPIHGLQINKNLVMTCVDQTGLSINVLKNGENKLYNIFEIFKEFPQLDNFYISDSSNTDNCFEIADWDTFNNRFCRG